LITFQEFGDLVAVLGVSGFMATESCEAWARAELGAVDLGDARLEGRAVRMVTAMARRPGGTVSRVFDSPKEREAAYRFIENERVEPSALVQACARGAAQRSTDRAFVYVPVDGACVRVVDRDLVKGFGPIGDHRTRARGLNVMSAIVVDPLGKVPLGLCAQVWWNRPRKPTGVKNHQRDKRPLEKRESHHWLTALRSVTELFRSETPSTRPWFQLDRGGDYRQVLKEATDRRLLLTVRATYNRRLDTSQPRYLFDTLAQRAVLGTYEVNVPARGGAPARIALLSVRAATVALRLNSPKGRTERVISIGAVYVREQRPPKGQKRIEWKLLTTYPVHSFEDALVIVDGYTSRWTIEEFHRAWKSGACDVEQSQLRAPATLQRWAIMLAAVALRIERLKKLSRESPELPATTELTATEIDAAYLLRRPNKPLAVGEVPTLGEATRWIADLGGYTGKSSGGPPGTVVLQRGMLRVLAAAEALDADRQRRATSEPQKRLVKKK
jgi:hypothetical protein